MNKFLDAITGNIFIFGGVMVFLFVMLVLFIYLIKKNTKKINIYEEDLVDEADGKFTNIKKEDIIEEPSHNVKDLEQIKDEEIIERVLEEHEKEEEKVLEQVKGSEIENMIEQMRIDRKAKPEEVVERFEKEQEEKAIISYQELVDSVKNNKIEFVDDEADYQPSDLVENMNALKQEIEEEPVLNSPSSDDIANILDNFDKQIKVNEKIDSLDVTIDGTPSSLLSLEKEIEKLDEETNKFTKTEFISPVYGRQIPDKVEYRKIPVKKEVKPVIQAVSTDTLLEETLDIKPINFEIKKNEEFLQALKDFRNSL